MIRFVTGLLLCFGSVGGLEHDTMGFAQFFLFSGIGLSLMFWAMPKLIAQGNA